MQHKWDIFWMQFYGIFSQPAPDRIENNRTELNDFGPVCCHQLQPVASQFRCLIWTQQRRQHINTQWTCIAGLPPHTDTPQVPWSPRQQHAGKNLSQEPLCLSRAHAVIHYQVLPDFALRGRAVATLFQFSGGVHAYFLPIALVNLPHLCFLSPPPPLLFSSHRLPSSQWYRPTLEQRQSAFVDSRSFREGRTHRLRTQQWTPSLSSLLLRVWVLFSPRIYLALSSTWGIQTSSKVKGKITFFPKYFN